MCDCFTCKNKANFERLYGYYYAEYNILKRIINTLDDLGVKRQCVHIGTIGSLYSVLEHSRDCAGVLLEKCKEELGIKDEND